MSVSTFRIIFRCCRVGQFSNSCLVFDRTKLFQGYQCYHGVNRVSNEGVQKGVFRSMDWNRKRKPGTLVWRQVSTQSTQNEDCTMVDVVTEPADIVNIEQGKNKMDEAEAMVGPSSTSLNDVQKVSVDISAESSTASVAQDISGVQDAGKADISKEKYAVSVEVAVGTPVMRFIKGQDGSTQKSVEDDMGVKIIFPQYKKGDSIVIKGDSMDDIAKASQQIQSIIDEAAMSPALAYSHFISLPLAIHPEFVEKVSKFQSSILGRGDRKHVSGVMKENSRAGASGDTGKIDQPKTGLAVGAELKTEDGGNRVKVDTLSIPTVSYAPKAKSPTLYDLRIDESIFLKPQRLHLTVLMLKLWNRQRVLAAMDVLQGICSEVNEVLDNRPLFVRLKGLDLIKGSKEKARVLYAPIEEVGDEGRLTRACQIITDAYRKAGLVVEKDAEQKLKLHATLMNTTFRRGRSKGKRIDNSFDARGIFNQFGSVEWGEYHIREAHLSQRFVYDDNGYYHCCTSIPLPDNSQARTSSTEPSQAEPEEKPMAESA
ncbi:hypothetical protein vseg_020789 [Gypsophila vaccaria]